MERGRVDLLLHADDGHVPLQYPREVIFEEDFVCVVARDFPCSRRLTLKQYLAASHIGVTIFGGKQTIPEQRLTAAGAMRHCPFSVPYFSMAICSVAGTSLIATVPRRLAQYEVRGRALKIVEAPAIMGRFQYLMTWHPRVNSDAAHLWLRSVVQAIGKTVMA